MNDIYTHIYIYIMVQCWVTKELLWLLESDPTVSFWLEMFFSVYDCTSWLWRPHSSSENQDLAVTTFWNLYIYIHIHTCVCIYIYTFVLYIYKFENFIIYTCFLYTYGYVLLYVLSFFLVYVNVLYIYIYLKISLYIHVVSSHISLYI